MLDDYNDSLPSSQIPLPEDGYRTDYAYASWIAKKILQNELDRKDEATEQYTPNVRLIPQGPVTPVLQKPFTGRSPDDPDMKYVIQQMLGNTGGGRT